MVCTSVSLIVGNDPSTDLRGTGFLGLLQLLFFVCDPRTAPMARDVYRLSLHETQVRRNINII